MDKEKIQAYGDELYDALRNRSVVDPLTEREPDITIEDAYHISLRMVNRRLDDGEKIVGKKIGVTSKAVQNMLNVHQPDFGYLTDRMVYGTSDEMPISSELIQPRAEGEIAFILNGDLEGPGVSTADVFACDRGCDAVLRDRRLAGARLEDKDPGYGRRQRFLWTVCAGRFAGRSARR